MTTPLADMTPVEIDTILADLDEKLGKSLLAVMRAKDILRRRAGDQQVTTGRHRHWKLTFSEALTLLDQKINALDEAGLKSPSGRLLVEARTNFRAAVDARAAIEAEIDPYEAEYGRRPWTRAFLALVNTKDGGHVHRSRNCSTCNNGIERTRFEWRVDYSALPEAEIVEAAGERACTVCYPSAPVEALGRPTRIFSKSEIERNAARQAREEKAAAKAAKAAAESITTPEGGPLYKGDSRRDKVEKLRTAEMAMAEALADIIWEKGRIGDPAWTYPNGRTPESRTPESRERDAAREAAYFHRAIAHKTGESLGEVFGRINPKATAKYKRDKREADKTSKRLGL